MAAAAGRAAGGAGLALVHHGRRQRPGRLAGAGHQPHRQRPVRVAAGRGGQLAASSRRPPPSSPWWWAAAPPGSSPVAVRAGRRALRWFDAALMLPLGTSAATIGFGFLIALDRPPFDLRDSLWLVPIAQALVAIPFVIRTITPVLRSIDQDLRSAAAVLGASPWRVWREVDLPIVFRAVVVAAGFAFAVSLGEFGATVFVVRADQPDRPGGHLPAAGPAGPAQARPGAGAEHGADGRHRGRRAADRPGARRHRWGSSDAACRCRRSLMLRRGGRAGLRRRRPPWPGSSLRGGRRARSWRCSGPAAVARPACCASWPASTPPDAGRMRARRPGPGRRARPTSGGSG